MTDETVPGNTIEREHGTYDIIDRKPCPYGDGSRSDYKIRAHADAEHMEEGETMWLCEDDL